jgi:hypothetical protein
MVAMMVGGISGQAEPALVPLPFFLILKELIKQ